MYPKICGKGSLYQALDESGVTAKDTEISRLALVHRRSLYHIGLKGKSGNCLMPEVN